MRGDAPVVVSLTSYGSRIRAVHLAVESMVHGTVRPQRLILWLREADVVADPPAPLARLVRRGLELRCTEDWGPHQKYYPYVRSRARHDATSSARSSGVRRAPPAGEEPSASRRTPWR